VRPQRGDQADDEHRRHQAKRGPQEKVVHGFRSGSRPNLNTTGCFAVNSRDRTKSLVLLVIFTKPALAQVPHRSHHAAPACAS
jgi:hypothetical protein